MFLNVNYCILIQHYNDIIMGGIASQITSLMIAYSGVYSGADQRKHQSSALLALCEEFTGDRWLPRTNGQLRGKCFHLMTSSWISPKFVFRGINNLLPWVQLVAWCRWGLVYWRIFPSPCLNELLPLDGFSTPTGPDVKKYSLRRVTKCVCLAIYDSFGV